MKTYECSFLDGPGKGRTFEIDLCPDMLWLRSVRGKRSWALRAPPPAQIEAVYERIGYAMRFDAPISLLFGLVLYDD